MRYSQCADIAYSIRWFPNEPDVYAFLLAVGILVDCPCFSVPCREASALSMDVDVASTA